MNAGITLSLPLETIQKIDEICAEKRVSRSQILRNAVVSVIDELYPDKVIKGEIDQEGKAIPIK